LSGSQVPHLGNIVPELGTLEDPDESRPIHMGKKEMKLYHSDPNEEKCDFEIVSSVEIQLFEKATCV